MEHMALQEEGMLPRLGARRLPERRDREGGLMLQGRLLAQGLGRIPDRSTSTDVAQQQVVYGGAWSW